jgi:hypothetical protein
MNERSPTRSAVEEILANATEEEREFFEERAAIAEFDGGLHREEAEKLAAESLLKLRMRRGTKASP